jgi:hypothetical protein
MLTLLSVVVCWFDIISIVCQSGGNSKAVDTSNSELDAKISVGLHIFMKVTSKFIYNIAGIFSILRYRNLPKVIVTDAALRTL